jgi:hypothetical protein
MRILALCCYVLFCTVLWTMTISCRSDKQGSEAGEDQSGQGKKLANKYCGTCHLPVDPALLDKETWKERVLPAMAKRLGLEVFQNHQYYQNKNSAISSEDWMKIVAWYDSLAPVRLTPALIPEPLVHDWSHFVLAKPKEDLTNAATSTMVSVDDKNRKIITSDAESSNLYHWDENLKQISSTKIPSPAVGLTYSREGNKIITCIGEMRALDVSVGEILSFGGMENSSHKSISKNLVRPINTQEGDFNKDGLTDYVVCSFGHEKGGLYWIKQLPDHTFQRIPIREVPRATQAITGDFDQDGWPDILALFAHGDEGIWLFTNDKKGGFIEKKLLRFPPVFGSSSIQLADINRDGRTDIIYTAGDNSDYSRILKPYHGLYIFTNHGSATDLAGPFQQSYFYPINGATKAIVSDFDLDGDPDIATIAFFGDLKNNPAETFIYFEQNSAQKDRNALFKPHALPIRQHGRWICMDVNDLDGDGDPDIVLGNYSQGFLNQDDFKPDWNTHSPFIVLKNQRNQ